MRADAGKTCDAAKVSAHPHHRASADCRRFDPKPEIFNFDAAG
jgi:hypothetical protein